MNKKWIVGGLVLGFIVLGLILISTLTPQESATEEVATDPTINEMVYIGSLKGYTQDLNSDQVDAIQTTLYGVASMNIENPKVSYIGKMRENSYKRKDAENGIYVVSFIADIPEIKKSWRVEYYVNTQGSDGSTPVVISCINEDERIYDSFECRDLNDQ